MDCKYIVQIVVAIIGASVSILIAFFGFYFNNKTLKENLKNNKEIANENFKNRIKEINISEKNKVLILIYEDWGNIITTIRELRSIYGTKEKVSDEKIKSLQEELLNKFNDEKHKNVCNAYSIYISKKLFVDCSDTNDYCVTKFIVMEEELKKNNFLEADIGGILNDTIGEIERFLLSAQKYLNETLEDNQ